MERRNDDDDDDNNNNNNNILCVFVYECVCVFVRINFQMKDML